MGFWLKDQTHGKGLKILSNGVAFEANFLNGKLVSVIRMITVDGKVYIGSFDADMVPHGKGTMTI